MTEVTGSPAVRLRGGAGMPLLGFGTWQVRGPQAYEAVRHALATGYRHLDTATFYGNEAEVGRAVRDSGVPREEIFVTTKLPPRQAGRERQTLADSLRELGTAYVDLWLVHWPPREQARPQTWREFLAVRDEGLARAVGVSNYSVAQLDELIAATGQAPEVNQIPWSPPRYDARLVAAHRERGVVVEGYSPFKGSDLGHPVLVEIAAAHGVTPAQVVLRWHIQHEIVVIPKSVTRERIAENYHVWGFTLTDAELTRIDALSGAAARGPRRDSGGRP
jgi:diketogulonate reductase-like aldo/keto reductase